jgi:hypothetical protein
MLDADRLITFYRGKARNGAGQHIDDVWAYDDGALEARHDFIQWLFPLPEPSPINPDAPVIDAEMQAAFHEDADLRARLLRSLDVMLRFYGLARDGATVRVGPRFAERGPHWLRAGDHNHLRLTRIMRSLDRLGEGAVARSLQRTLLDLAATHGPRAVTPTTERYWRSAFG